MTKNEKKNPMENRLAKALLATSILAIAGCGGGGGSDSSGVTPTPQPPVEPPQVAAEIYHQAINYDPATAEFTGRGVNVAIYDSGIFIDHNEFPGERISQYSAALVSEFSGPGDVFSREYKVFDIRHYGVEDNHQANMPEEGLPSSDHTHGSRVAGALLGETVGIARGVTAKIYDVVFSAERDINTGTRFNIDPTGTWAKDTDAAHLHIAGKGVSGQNLQIDFANISIDDAFSYKPVVEGASDAVNHSNTTEIFDAIESQTTTAIVASAGNEGANLTEIFRDSDEGNNLFNARLPHAYSDNYREISIVVGATNEDGSELASFSNYPGDDERLQERFILAPGMGIKGAHHIDTDRTVSSNGTSFAAPIVTGAAAVVKEAFPDLANRQILNILLDTASKDIPDYDPRLHGMGLLDVEAALNVNPLDYL